ncbi:hypothetical protein BNJ_00004 [Kaumoebavirus]|uniref:hypothetical protein n=1 Tax=Kaumoebavirus TaxID=1859492 RepID=UPI0009C21498|nr:hypothetical protein BNJ_00004 [Kaumoebavirus]ARA71851.1 hypothetical protein BNJ_00004 [Kaumoebavirus]
MWKTGIASWGLLEKKKFKVKNIQQEMSTKKLDKFVFVLKLKGNNYFVGITTDVDRRIQQHSEGKGAEWTRLHPPIEKVEVLENGTTELQNETVLKYIEMYGWEKVRGSTFIDPIQKNHQVGIERLKKDYIPSATKKPPRIYTKKEPKKLTKEEKKLDKKLKEFEVNCKGPMYVRDPANYKIDQVVRTTEIENSVWGGSRIID